MQPSNQTSIMSNIKVDHVILGPFYVHFPTTKCAAPQGTVWRFSSAMESFFFYVRGFLVWVWVTWCIIIVSQYSIDLQEVVMHQDVPSKAGNKENAS